VNTTKSSSEGNPALVTVMAATGRIGKRISEKLLTAGVRVRALGRSESKLSELRSAGAETFAGDAADIPFLAEAFRGADAVYTALPYDPQEFDYFAQQSRIGEGIIEAVRQTDARYVVFLSSVGADQPSGTGMIESLHHQEQRLRRLDGMNILTLRPGPFFENLYGLLEVIKYEGIGGDAFAPDLPLPMIATRDIADAAADALKARNWKGIAVRELLGQRDSSFAEVTRIIGERIGRPNLDYVQFPYADTVKALTQFGFSENIATLEVGVARAANEGRIKSREGRNPQNTTATPFEDFADEMARAYQVAQEPFFSQ
jgi:uncharacterized protein YbjT (DUF2867 family)